MIALLLACAHAALVPVAPQARVDPLADLAPHEGAQTEWWHVHADLVDGATGEPVHVFAAFLAERTGDDHAGPLPVQPFVDPLWLAWVKVQTPTHTWVADRASFPDLFAAGAAREGLALHHGDWHLAWEHGALVLQVSAGPERLDLRLVPTRPPTLPGEGGNLVLRPGGGRSMWEQWEEMAVEGRWERHGKAGWLQGSGFFKHQWGRLYDPRVDGFTWVSLDLPDGRSLSVAWLQEEGTGGSPGSRAWWSDGTPIAGEDLHLEVTRTWRSHRSATTWPVAWHLQAPGVDFMLQALHDNQEIWAFPAALHVGPAHAVGQVAGLAVDQLAFVEQTGARPTPLRVFLRSDAP